jgi:FkbM family methyltransferase
MIEDFIKFLKNENYDLTKEVTIFDIGSRDCLQSIEFTKSFPKSKIYAFECNPNTLDICKNNILNYPQITLINKAVNYYDGLCKFFPINQQKTITSWKDGNPGASSLFKSNDTYPIERYIQDEIIIDCVTLETVMEEHKINKCDIIWMDLQGAELIALESMKDKINFVDYIYTEVSFKPIYEEQVMFDELNNFLVSKNFKLCNSLDKNCWQTDAIYKRIV